MLTTPVARVDVDLGAIQRNLRTVAGHCRLPVYCVVKADAYGHGAKEVARALSEMTACNGFMVARMEEALALRDPSVLGRFHGHRQPVICFGVFLGSFEASERDKLLALLVRERIAPVLASHEDLEALLEAEESVRRALPPVHLAFDTGMHREGLEPKATATALRRLQESCIRVGSLFSHLVESEIVGSTVSMQQRALFESVIEEVGRDSSPPAHLANSAGALDHSGRSAMDPLRDAAVRAGGALYGLDLRRESTSPNLEPAMSVLTRLVQVRRVKKGASVGYNHTWRAQRDSILGLVAAGYADGLGQDPPRLGWVQENRMHRVPVVGALSMDLTTVDLTDARVGANRFPRVGDQMVLLGKPSSAEAEPDGYGPPITASEHAAPRGASPYSVTIAFSQRLPIRFTEPGQSR